MGGTSGGILKERSFLLGPLKVQSFLEADSTDGWLPETKGGR